jgi:hypothetical protein
MRAPRLDQRASQINPRPTNKGFICFKVRPLFKHKQKNNSYDNVKGKKLELKD